MTLDDDEEGEGVGLPAEFEMHDPLAEDLTRLIETWGLATVIHGVKCMAVQRAEASTDDDERRSLELIAQQLDGAWVDAEGGER